MTNASLDEHQGDQEETMTAQPTGDQNLVEDPRVAQHAAVPTGGRAKPREAGPDRNVAALLYPRPSPQIRGQIGAEMAAGAAAMRARRGRPVPRVGELVNACETPEEVRARRAEGDAFRRRQWEAGVPTKFRDARLATLQADQHPAQLRTWFESTSPMLVLASKINGNGKSHAAYALGWHAYDTGLWVHARTMADLIAALRPVSKEFEPECWHTVTRCDVLIIDELGKEKITDWTLEQFGRLVDQRWREERRTIITTNKTSAEIERMYDSAIADRIVDDSLALVFTGASKRKARSW